jgi:putative endonuclease
MTKKSFATRGIDSAIAYLERNGIQVVDANFPTPHGEIPIVAVDGETLVRVNVKVTKSNGKLKTEVTPTKPTQAKYKEQLRDYISVNVPGKFPVCIRFDDIQLLVISEDRAMLRHTKGVFE